MEKEFIPYEQALALKELGFNEPCVARYNDKGDFSFGMFQFLKSNSEANTIEGTFIGENGCYVPTYSQAFRWFREVHNLHLLPIRNGSRWYCTFGSWVSKIYDTYEEAELACLKKLIEIVKKK